MAPALFELSVKAIVVNDDQQVLVLKRHSFSGDLFCDLPGGRLEDGDDIFTALQRELLDEIGCLAIGSKAQLIHAELWDDEDWDGPAKVLLYYRIDGVKLDEITLSDEHAGYLWLEPRALPESEEGDDTAVVDGARLEPALRDLLERRLLTASSFR